MLFLELTTEPWGKRTCSIADPEGNAIKIGSWDKTYEEKDNEKDQSGCIAMSLCRCF